MMKFLPLLLTLVVTEASATSQCGLRYESGSQEIHQWESLTLEKVLTSPEFKYSQTTWDLFADIGKDIGINHPQFSKWVTSTLGAEKVFGANMFQLGGTFDLIASTSKYILGFGGFLLSVNSDKATEMSIGLDSIGTAAATPAFATSMAPSLLSRLPAKWQGKAAMSLIPKDGAIARLMAHPLLGATIGTVIFWAKTELDLKAAKRKMKDERST
ncbi:MAG: hypothetical protein HN348_36065, partial [Proteobacteria bacterium]|nr:hypothetical protein [Pseudomonadota bacterium]